MSEPKPTHTKVMCLACGGSLREYREDDYAECVHCGSFCYLGPDEAQESNRRYFERGDVWDVPESSIRRLLMRIMEQFDKLQRSDEYARFDATEARFTDLALASSSILEVGFGDGDWLVWALNHGLNANGIDLSHRAVQRFQLRHTEYADRVQHAIEPKGRFDLVYANAVFEHVGSPSQFLEDAASAVAPEGWLVLGLPMRSTERSTLPTAFDINFWKPYHRAIYSASGLSTLMRRYGFLVEIEAALDRYAYRVMNVLLRRGFTFVNHLRTPVAKTREGPGAVEFLQVLFEARWLRSPSVWARIVAKRTVS